MVEEARKYGELVIISIKWSIVVGCSICRYGFFVMIAAPQMKFHTMWLHTNARAVALTTPDWLRGTPSASTYSCHPLRPTTLSYPDGVAWWSCAEKIWPFPLLLMILKIPNCPGRKRWRKPQYSEEVKKICTLSYLSMLRPSQGETFR